MRGRQAAHITGLTPFHRQAGVFAEGVVIVGRVMRAADR